MKIIFQFALLVYIVFGANLVLNNFEISKQTNFDVVKEYDLHTQQISGTDRDNQKDPSEFRFEKPVFNFLIVKARDNFLYSILIKQQKVRTKNNFDIRIILWESDTSPPVKIS